MSVVGVKRPNVGTRENCFLSLRFVFCAGCIWGKSKQRRIKRLKGKYFNTYIFLLGPPEIMSFPLIKRRKYDFQQFSNALPLFLFTNFFKHQHLKPLKKPKVIPWRCPQNLQLWMRLKEFTLPWRVGIRAALIASHKAGCSRSWNPESIIGSMCEMFFFTCKDGPAFHQ